MKSAAGGVYEYDFGDGWTHLIVLEGVVDVHGDGRRPRCIAGERHCPPEDCGGAAGYADFLAAANNPSSEEHEAMLEWAGGAFDADDFDPASVTFDDPKRRWKQTFMAEPSE